MNFEDWMIHRGLSTSSAEKYAGAVSGPITQWAINANLITGPLTGVSSLAQFSELAPRIRALSIFIERNERGHSMYSSALKKFAEYLADRNGGNVETDIDEIVQRVDLSSTEKISLIKARIGQGFFRQKVLFHWESCAVTGFKDSNLLVASHIKPWKDSTNYERLDPYNGLLLSPNIDRAFDAGLITFMANGLISLSSQFAEPEKLGIHSEMRVKLDARHETYMQFHRANVFRAK